MSVYTWAVSLSARHRKSRSSSWVSSSGRAVGHSWAPVAGEWGRDLHRHRLYVLRRKAYRPEIVWLPRDGALLSVFALVTERRKAGEPARGDFGGVPHIEGHEPAVPVDRFTSAGGYKYFTFTVADPSKAIGAVLVYHDASGAVNAAGVRVNEIDMYVLQGGAVYCDGQYGGQYATVLGMLAAGHVEQREARPYRAEQLHRPVHDSDRRRQRFRERGPRTGQRKPQPGLGTLCLQRHSQLGSVSAL